MKKAETNRFDKLYQRHLRLLKLQGKSQSTIDAYSRAVRRIHDYFDCCPDKLTLKQREQYFSDLVKSHSWSTVKIDRNGLMFFWKHALNRHLYRGVIAENNMKGMGSEWGMGKEWGQTLNCEFIVLSLPHRSLSVRIFSLKELTILLIVE